MTWVIWNLSSFYLKVVLVSVQDRCTVCAKRTIGSETFWTHLMVLLREEAQVEARFGPFGDSVKLNATSVCGLCRTDHRLRNILDAPDGTTR